MRYDQQQYIPYLLTYISFLSIYETFREPVIEGITIHWAECCPSSGQVVLLVDSNPRFSTVIIRGLSASGLSGFPSILTCLSDGRVA